MENPQGIIGGTPETFEIEFKGGRKALFANPRNIPFRVGDHAVVDLDRGTDIGVVIREGQDASQVMRDKGVRGPILRRATSRDLNHLSDLREKEAEAHRICQQCIAKQDLPMKLVDVEWQFDGNKIRFYFTSDHRVDFRKLVRDLAATFKTRIEMRQIGVRDEARRLGGYGRCGRYYCCRGVIHDFDPVTLKMVKEQHLAPGSPKISGGCGRLMCCLRYERDFYTESSREFPKVGTKVSLTGGGRGRVVAVDIFRRKVAVSDDEGKTISVSIEDFRAGRIRGSEPSPERAEEMPLPDPMLVGASSGEVGAEKPRGERRESDSTSADSGRGQAREGARGRRRRPRRSKGSSAPSEGAAAEKGTDARKATGPDAGKAKGTDANKAKGTDANKAKGGDVGSGEGVRSEGEAKAAPQKKRSDRRRRSGRSRRRRGSRRKSGGSGKGTDGK